MITPMQLKAAFPACRNPGIWCRAFDKTVDEFDLREPNRLAMWLAQCGFESASFNTMREVLAYRTPAHLREVFPKEFPTDDDAMRYVMNPVGLGNFIYAGKNGNGDVASGDGFKFRGGGLIQLSGRANYKGVGEGLGIDLEARPMQIMQENTAARTAGFYWRQHDLNAAADAGDFDYTTKAINGPAMLGADARRVLWQTLTQVMANPDAVAVASAARRAITPPADGIMTPGGTWDQATTDFVAPLEASP